MNAVEKQYRQVLLQMERKYVLALTGKIAWSDFEKSTREVLRWTAAIAASKTRYQAIRERAILPHHEPFRLDELLSENEWLVDQDTAISKYAKERAQFIASVEKSFLADRGHALDAESLQRAAASRFTMFYRNMVSDMLSLSAHSAANSMELSGKLPFAMYVTMKDERTRKTHAAMNGFVATANDPIWRIIRPPCGYNCRCTLRLISLAEARQYGWMSGEKPRFSQKWPRGMARQNFALGIFPDSGWHGPKEIARL